MTITSFIFGSCKKDEVTPTPVADFTYEQQDLYGEASDKGYKVVFTQNCTDATSYDWSFYNVYDGENGSDVTGSGETFDYHYLVPGEYYITLTASNIDYSDTEYKDIFVEGQTVSISDYSSDNFSDVDYGSIIIYLYKTEADMNNDENDIAFVILNKGESDYIPNLKEETSYYIKGWNYINDQAYEGMNSFIAKKNELTYAGIFLTEIK